VSNIKQEKANCSPMLGSTRRHRRTAVRPGWHDAISGGQVVADPRAKTLLRDSSTALPTPLARHEQVRTRRLSDSKTASPPLPNRPDAGGPPRPRCPFHGAFHGTAHALPHGLTHRRTPGGKGAERRPLHSSCRAARLDPGCRRRLRRPTVGLGPRDLRCRRVTRAAPAAQSAESPAGPGPVAQEAPTPGTRPLRGTEGTFMPVAVTGRGAPGRGSRLLAWGGATSHGAARARTTGEGVTDAPWGCNRSGVGVPRLMTRPELCAP
jgi:hypothetical protein